MQRRGQIVLLGVAVLLVGLYALAGFVWVPRIARSTLLESLEQDYGRKATLGSTRFNPFTFEFEAEEFSLPDTDGARLAEFDRLYMDFELSSIWRRAWTFGAITLEMPYVRVVQKADGSLNLSDLKSRRSEPKDESAAPFPALRIEMLDVQHGVIDIVDWQRAETFRTTLRPVTFKLADFASRGDGNEFSLTAGTDRAGRLALDGALDTQPLEIRGRLTLSGLPAATITEYFGDAIPVAFRNGLLDFEVGFEFSLAGVPYRFALDVPIIAARGLETVARGHEVPWTWPVVQVRDTQLDVPARQVTIGAIEVQAPVTPFWIDAGGFQAPGALALNLPPSPGAEPAAAEPSSAVPAATGARWQLAIETIAVADAIVGFEDRRLAAPAVLALTLSELRIRDVTWPQTAPLALTARIESAAGGALGVDGSLSIDPVTVDVEVSTEILDLRPVQAWLEADTDLELQGGTLTSRGRFAYDEAARPQFQYSGDVTVTKLYTRDGTQRRDFINWAALELKAVELSRLPNRLAVREVIARDPYLRLIIAENGVTNLLSVLNPEEAARRAAEIAAEHVTRDSGREPEPDADDDAVEPPLARGGSEAPPAQSVSAANIGSVRIQNGSVNFSDFTLRPSFEISVERLTGGVGRMTSNPDQRARLELAGEVDRYAPAHIEGDINLLSRHAFLDIVAGFRNVELTSFNPYSTKFAGYRIDKGKLSIETEYRIEDRRLKAEHRLTLDQLQLGERIESPDAVSLPLKLAVALLKDRNGVIDIDLPVSGTLDDPKFRIGRIIWKAVVGLLVKVATSPFKLISSLFGGGADLSEVVFAPGSATLDPQALARLESLKTAMAERPGLSIDIPETADPETDRLAIEQSEWSRLMGGLDESDRKVWLAALEEAHRLRLGSKPEIPKPPKAAEGEPKADPLEHAIAFVEPAVRATIRVDEATLAALGQARARAVRDALLAVGTIDPARVFIIRGEPVTATEGTVRMVLTLK